MISFGIDFIFKIFVFLINVACFSIWISSVKENHLLWPLYFKMVLEMKFIDEAKYLSFCMESTASFLAWHSCKYHIPSGCYHLCLCLSYNWTFSLLLSYIYMPFITFTCFIISFFFENSMFLLLWHWNFIFSVLIRILSLLWERAVVFFFFFLEWLLLRWAIIESVHFSDFH